METLNVESLNEVKKQIAARFERASQEGITAARGGAEALAKACEAQCKTGRDLLRKSAEILDEIRKVEPVRRLRAFGAAVAATARKSADAWLDLVETSLGRARRALRAFIDERPNAA